MYISIPILISLLYAEFIDAAYWQDMRCYCNIRIHISIVRYISIHISIPILISLLYTEFIDAAYWEEMSGYW